MPIIARDGAYDQVGGLSVGVPEITFPFIRNGDSVARIIRRRAKQTPAAWLVDRAAARFTPGETFDAEYPDAVLVEQSDPTTTDTGLYAIGRTFATVPGDQITYGSRVITKPAFPTNDYAGSWSDSTDSATTANIWSPVIAATISPYPSGGTFTLSYKGTATGALAWNASTATIAAALDALATAIADVVTFSVIGSVGAGSLILSRATGVTNWVSSDITVDPALLTPASIAGINGSTGNIADVRFARSAINFNKTAHGLTTGDSVRTVSGSTGGGTLRTATVVDADNFTVPNAAIIAPGASGYRTFVRTYTPGTDRVRMRRTQRFYLPGYTTGITTPADIPLPTLLMNDGDFLTAIASNTVGFTDYDASELTRWNDWPIYTQTFEALDLASV